MTDSEPRRLLIMGPPGAGKGTQAALLAARLGIPAISTGDMFRRELEQGSELGHRARDAVDAGRYVPDSLTNEIVARRLGAADVADGFLLDGYPRTLAQAHELERVLAAGGTRLDAVVLLAADHTILLARLEGRAGVEGRSDDRGDVILHRIELYEEQTAPLASFYAERGKLVRVDGGRTVAEVAQSIALGLALPADPTLDATGHGARPRTGT